MHFEIEASGSSSHEEDAYDQVPFGSKYEDQIKPVCNAVSMQGRVTAQKVYSFLFDLSLITFLVVALERSPYIPQHTEVAGEVIERTRGLIFGDSAGFALNYFANKTNVAPALNATVVDAFRSMVLQASNQRCYNPSNAPGSCSERLPLRGGLWAYILKKERSPEASNCWSSDSFLRMTKPLLIEGFYGSYSLVEDCNMARAVEVGPDVPVDKAMDELNQFTAFIEDTFMWDVNAVVITSQLDWAPVKTYDSFSFLMMEQSSVGLLATSKYFYARDYSPGRNTDKTSHFLAFMALSFFSIWASRRAGFRTPLGRGGWCVFFLLCFMPAWVNMVESETAGHPSRAQYLLAVPLVTYGGLHTLLPRWKHLARPGGRHGTTVWFYGLEGEEESLLGRGLSGTLQSFTLRLLAWAATTTIALIYHYYSFSSFANLFLLLGLWLLYIVVQCSIGLHKRRNINVWDGVDFLLLGSSIWMVVGLVEYWRLSVFIKGGWRVSRETAAFMVTASPTYDTPISLVFFFLLLRMLTVLQVFPLLYIPMRSFTRSINELAAYTLVFIIITAAFGLLFMYTVGGNVPEVSGFGNAFLSLLPDIVVGGGGTPHGFNAGIYRKRAWTTVISLVYAFVTTFFVSNLLFAIVWEAYIAVKEEPRSHMWVDRSLLHYMADNLDHLSKRKRICPGMCARALSGVSSRLRRLKADDRKEGQPSTTLSPGHGRSTSHIMNYHNSMSWSGGGGDNLVVAARLEEMQETLERVLGLLRDREERLQCVEAALRQHSSGRPCTHSGPSSTCGVNTSPRVGEAEERKIPPPT